MPLDLRVVALGRGSDRRTIRPRFFSSLSFSDEEVEDEVDSVL